ncbi:TetR/AcrR family transcriptional regulator [Leptospira sp. GIMC2001]|uniref:TetR/AcrR family transcriptional regulator n=1 Tax=Leptospira sp. GIMC2001 TaxID=1513297 RepID=UPI00234B0417|nr:TetR/AcrR family transcriptional regulator [Leptospira sp. GIMC2001]WCL47598.1 TetR/AcrR family transcriptional regulator [Leptospira sp. GIMC2001]
MSKANKLSTRDRIIQTSKKLFLSQGYGETGLNQIVSEAETVKASLYQHFPSKEELGRCILREYTRENLMLLEGLANRYSNPRDFVKYWCKFLKREAKQHNIHGCAMANFRSQIADKAPDILLDIKDVTSRTLQILEKYLLEAKKKGLISDSINPKVEARLLFSVYEGVMQTWRLTGDSNAIDDLVLIAGRLYSE